MPQPTTSEPITFLTGEQYDNQYVPRFDLADPPETLVATDAPNQLDMYDYVDLQAASELEGGESYAEAQVHQISLSELRRLYESKEKAAAIRMLQKRYNLKLDSNAIERSDSRNIGFKFSGHYLDYFLAVSKSPGLGAFLPSMFPPHTFHFTLRPNKNRQFRAGYGRIGFDPCGSMFFLGEASHGEAWIGLRPRDNHFRDVELDRRTKNTTLSNDRSKVLLLFLGYCAHGLAGHPFQCHNMYGPPMSKDFDWNSSDQNNLLSTVAPNGYKLNYQSTLAFDALIVEEWKKFGTGAPAHIKETGIFENDLVSIAHNFGQNQAVVSDTETDREADNWEAELKYANIEFLTVALATHIRGLTADAWEERPIDELEEEGSLYDSPIRTNRERVDLETLELYDEDGNENRIYGEDGIYVPRIVPRSYSRVTNGVSVKMRDFSNLLYRPDHLREPGISLYPQAFLRTIGNVQANTTMPLLDFIVDEINDNHGDFLEDTMDMDTDEQTHLRKTVVTGISSQYYNAVSHRTRQSTQRHDVQMGRITTALAGTWATTDKGEKTSKEFNKLCEDGLPHERFERQIADIPVSEGDEHSPLRDFRMEQVWTIDVSALPVEKRCGRFIFINIIYALVNAWRKNGVMQAIRPHLVVFKQKVFPEVYSWTTFPITALLERIWNETKKGQVKPMVLELVACLERALAYAHTGHTKVLSRELLHPLWFFTSLLQHGLPTLNPDIGLYQTGHHIISLALSRWPKNRLTRKPATASSAVQIYNYGEHHYRDYICRFEIDLCLVQDHRTLGVVQDHRMHGVSGEMVKCVLIADIAYNAFINDVKSLVTKHVEQRCTALRRAGDTTRATEREASLKLWLKNSTPLSYKNNGYSQLVSTLTELASEEGGLPARHQDKLRMEGWVNKAFEELDRVGSVKPRAPFPEGSSACIFRIARERIIKHAKLHQEPGESTMNAFRIAARKLPMNFAPWIIRETGRGNQSNRVTAASWIFFNSQEPRPTVALRRDFAMEAQVKAETNDPNFEWSVAGLTIQHLPQYLNKSEPPTEFSKKYANLDQADELTKETYDYIIGQFDMTKPLHHLVFFTAILLSKLAPDIFWDSTAARGAAELRGTALTSYIQGLPFVSRNKKGLTDKVPFIVMFTVYVLAYYDKCSPVWEHLRNQGGLTKQYSEKHSNKAISLVQIVRLGLAHAEAPRIFKGHREGDWILLTNEQLKTRHSKYLSLMQDGQYGPFEATSFIVGINAALQLARTNGEMAIPPELSGPALKRKHSTAVGDEGHPHPRIRRSA